MLHLVCCVLKITQDTCLNNRLDLRLLRANSMDLCPQIISPYHAYLYLYFIPVSFPATLLFKILCVSLLCFQCCYKPISLLEHHDCKYDNAKDHRQCKRRVVPSIIEKIFSGTELISEQCLLGLCCYCTLPILHKKTAYLLFRVGDFRVLRKRVFLRHLMLLQMGC